MQLNPFEYARQIPSVEVARRAGLPLRRRGAREWACCPLHGEKTPSLCFYPDGGWHCFGCHAGGDAVDLHAALHGVDKLEAARALAGDSAVRPLPMAPRRPKEPPFLSGRDEDGFTWDRLCAIKHAAQAQMDAQAGDTEALWDALAARSAAEERLENLLAGEEARHRHYAWDGPHKEVKRRDEQRGHPEAV